MKRVYEDAKKMLEREIEEITRKGNIGMDDITLLDKLLDNLKDISIICAMEEEGYSEGESYRRDSMGRYASRGSYENGSYRGSYGDSYRGSYENGYSGHEDYDRMMADAKSEKERELIRQLKEMKR